MQRDVFLAGLTASVASSLSPASPVPGPSVAPSPGVSDELVCEENPNLPYDKRLEFVDSTLDGPEFYLSKYRGFAVWINIFATWCGPCNEEQRRVVETSERYYDKGLRTIGLFAREEDDKIRDYRKKYGIRYPLVRDANGILTANLGSRGFPSHLFITAPGLLYCYEVGSIDFDIIDTAIAGLLASVTLPLPPEPAPTRTPALPAASSTPR